MNGQEQRTPGEVVRVDMHCHSSASQESRLGVQRSVGLPECATGPDEVYELARRRGMDFVTITDHDTIAGVMQIADRPDVFISEELTAKLPGRASGGARALLRHHPSKTTTGCRPTAVTSSCARRTMHERDIACALAHPYYTVAAPLTPRHRRRLAELFGVWETRNGARGCGAQPVPRRRMSRHATGSASAASDDHAGVDIGRTFTEAPAASSPRESSTHMRAGRVVGARRPGQRRQVGACRDSPQCSCARPAGAGLAALADRSRPDHADGEPAPARGRRPRGGTPAAR